MINYAVVAVKESTDDNAFIDVLHVEFFEEKPTKEDIELIKKEFNFGEDVLVGEANADMMQFLNTQFELSKHSENDIINPS